MRIAGRWTASYEFACHTASCRPPGSGGTGGSDSVSAASFSHKAVERSSSSWGGGGPQNAWLNYDGSVTPVEHHEDGGGYTQATLKNKVRIISMPHRGELTVDASLMNRGLSQSQIDSARVMFALTGAKTLYIGGPRNIWETKRLEINARDVEGELGKLNEAFG